MGTEATMRSSAPCYRMMLVCALGCESVPCRSIVGAEIWEAGDDGPLCVAGDLYVSGREGGELEPVTRVVEVTGSFVVHNNPHLAEFPRLDALGQVGGSLVIATNERLGAVRGFPALEYVGGGLYVGENPNLVTLELGGRLTEVASVLVALNPRLTSLGGFDSLESVLGDCVVRDNLSLVRVEFSALEEVGGTLLLSILPVLEDAALPALLEIGGSLSVVSTGRLKSLAGFSSIERVQGTIVISSNDGLEEVSLSAPFPELEGLQLRDNPKLERVHAADSVRLSSATTVVFARNPGLRSIDGFEGVEALGGLIFADNDQLEDVAGWTGLERLNGALGLRITHNPALAGSGELLPVLRRAEDVWIFGNGALEPEFVDELLLRVETPAVPRIGDNRGEDTALDPCPWPEDGVCDADIDVLGGSGTALCVVDTEDCEV